MISRLRSLKLFDINSNNLSGEIPVGIWNLTELETLAVYSNNKIKGVIPKAIGNLKSLGKILCFSFFSWFDDIISHAELSNQIWLFLEPIYKLILILHLLT